MRKLAPLLCIAILLSSYGSSAEVQAQEASTRQIDLLRADSLTEGLVSGQRVRNLFGNVWLRQDSTLLNARRVMQFIEQDEYLFLGNVLIVENGDSLQADSVLYDKSTKVGRANGSVRLSDGDVQVLAPSALYFVDEKKGRFDEGVMLIDSLTQLTSQTGTYWSDDKRADFADKVRLYDPNSYLEADSITHFRETEVSLARGNVFVERIGASEADITTRMLLFGEEVYTDSRSEVSRARGAPLLLQIRFDSLGVPADSLIVSARYLESIKDDSLQRLVAIDSVQVWQHEFAATADSLQLDRIDLMDNQSSSLEETWLYKSPGLWVRETQITGDTIRMVSANEELDSLFVKGNVFVAQQDSASGRLNQMRGQSMVGVFGADSSSIFNIAQNAEAIYQLKDEDDQPDGAVQLAGDQLEFMVIDEDPVRISVVGDPSGTFYTEDLIPTSLSLQGLKWSPEARPQKQKLLNREQVRSRLLRLQYQPEKAHGEFSTQPPENDEDPAEL